MPASLRDIEQALVTLWMNRRARDTFLQGKSGRRSGRTAVDKLPPELVEQIDKRGINLYASLLNFGHQDVMLSIYPGCAKLLGDKWAAVVDSYLEHYPPGHYNFNRTAERFSEYLTKYGERHRKKYPFIAELAEYEWLELQVMETAVEVEVAAYEQLTRPEQFESSGPLVNPTLVVRRYCYPIPDIVDHLRDDCCLPRKVEPKPTSVALYRDPYGHHCRFLELGDLAAAVVDTARQSRQSYAALAALVVGLSGEKGAEQSVLEFLELVDKLQSLYLFVGSTDVS
ncbi:MAG TPA: putative DNA-binding domain-containing protein [Candidatus Obscuribacterales bacterium]